MCQPSRCSPKRGRHEGKDAGPQRGVDLVGVPHRLEKGRSTSKNVGPKGGGL